MIFLHSNKLHETSDRMYRFILRAIFLRHQTPATSAQVSAWDVQHLCFMELFPGGEMRPLMQDSAGCGSHLADHLSRSATTAVQRFEAMALIGMRTLWVIRRCIRLFKSQDTYEEMSFANMSIIALTENCPFCVRVHFREAEFPDPVEFLSSVKQHAGKL